MSKVLHKDVTIVYFDLLVQCSLYIILLNVSMLRGIN